MMSTQLISGRIADFIPIGQDGQPIYLNAEAFRAALSITPLIGEEKVKYLAIPKIRADGQNIDWYVPFPPQVNNSQYHIISWDKATPTEQQKALALLDSFEQSLKRLGQDLMRRANDSKSMLFAHYLTGQNTIQQLPAIHFPGPEYIYIVDGIPVITFWGFSSKNDNLVNGPFHLLHHPELRLAAAEAATPFVATAPVMENDPAPAPSLQYPIVKRESHFPKWLWLLIPLILFLLWLFLWLLPHMGLYGEQKTVFDENYNTTISEIKSNNNELNKQNSNKEQNVISDRGTLLDRVPNKVDELQDVTDPKQVRKLLDAPELADKNNNNNSTRTSNSTSRYESERNVNINNEYHIIDGSDPNAPNAVLSNTDSSSYSSDYNEQVDVNVNRDVRLYGSSAPLANADDNAANNNSSESSDSSTSSDSNSDLYSASYTIGGEGESLDDNANNYGDGVNGANVDRSQRMGSLPVVDPFGDEGDAAFAREQAAMQGQAQGHNGVAISGNDASNNGMIEDEREILSFTTDSLTKQGTAIFNGNWIARSGLMDSISGKPLQLGYKVNNGVGQAVVYRYDKVQCVADISLKATNNSFYIAPSDRARCPDKTTYRLPNVQCESDTNGQVKCWGSYDDRRFPIRLYREL